MKLKVKYSTYALILFTILSLITTFATIFSPIIDSRIVITSIKYIFLSLIVFSTITLYANSKKKKEKHNNAIFTIISSFYFLGYSFASFTYIITNQILRSQSFLFLYKVFPIMEVMLGITIWILFFFSIIFIKNKFILFSKDSKQSKKIIKRILIVSFIIFLLFIFLIPPFFNIFNPLVNEYVEGNTIYIHPDTTQNNKLITEKTNLKNPNVIVILLESISANRLSSYGYYRNVTPNIDNLAKKSIVFKNTYSTCTHSDYAQPAFLSSRYMLTNNLRNFFKNNHDRTMVWDVFKNRDYFTSYFSSEDDLWAGMDDYFNYNNLDIYSYSLTDGKYDYGSGLAKKDYDHITMNKAINWLTNYKEEKPFFLYMNLQATHKPLTYPEEYAYYKPDNNKIISENILKWKNVTSVNNRYDNALRYVDIQVGRLINELNKKGYLNNTVILLSSDHGHDFEWEHSINGHGNSVYNDELMTPMLLYVPDIAPKNISEIVSHIDAIPTLIDVLGLKSFKNFMGKPMRVKGRFFFYAQNHKHFIGMYKNDLKIIIDLNKKTAEVYNVSRDINEKNNLLKEKHYDEEILELLMWHKCQVDYFSKIKPNKKLKEYCENFLK